MGGDEQTSTRAVASVSYRGTETILLAEGQDDVRVVAAKILKRRGYLVLEATNAGEALLTCEKYPEPYIFWSPM